MSETNLALWIGAVNFYNQIFFQRHQIKGCEICPKSCTMLHVVICIVSTMYFWAMSLYMLRCTSGSLTSVSPPDSLPQAKASCNVRVGSLFWALNCTLVTHPSTVSVLLLLWQDFWWSKRLTVVESGVGTLSVASFCEGHFQHVRLFEPEPHWSIRVVVWKNVKRRLKNKIYCGKDRDLRCNKINNRAYYGTIYTLQSLLGMVRYR